jgi:capsular exopolysaccharide synthesis family protein
MELKELVALYRRWIWLLVAGLILGLVSGFAASKIQTPIYEASAKVLITRSGQSSITDIMPLSDQQLVLTYQQVLKTRPVLEEAESRLNANIVPSNINVNVVPNTQIIQIKVQDKRAKQAAAIANALVQILVEQNETLQAGRYAIYEENLSSQIDQVQVQINDLRGQITQINQANIEEQLDMVDKQIVALQVETSNLEEEIAKFPLKLTADERASVAEKETQVSQLRSLLSLYQEIQTNLTFIGQPLPESAGREDPQLASLRATLNLYQELYLNLLNNLETVKLARAEKTPTVTQIEEAAIPEIPVRPIPLLYIAVSAIVGLLIAAGAILLIDYFDDTLKSAQKIQEALGIPVIGQIGEANHTNGAAGGLFLFDRANSSLSNAFGSLKVGVGRLAAQKSLKTLLITSPGIGEGKTTIAANLAAAFVRSGSRVVLLDADLYHPQMHSLLGLDNQMGLTNILADNEDWHAVAQDSAGITVITSGTHSGSSAVLLESDKVSQLLKKLQKEADVIIIDGPPLFIVDAQILVAKVSGILLVVRQGNTLTAVARAMLDQLRLMDANVLGVVLNRVPRTDTYYFDGYYRGASEAKPKEKVKKVANNQT